MWYEQTCLKVKKNGKYGLIDFSGKVLLECEYDEIKPINALNIELEVGNTAVGNERVPVLNNIELEYAHI